MSLGDNPPPAPVQRAVDGNLEKLVDGVRKALKAVPGHFDTATRVDGIEVNDLFNLNTVMGSTIELQVVKTLNRLRHVWDPEGLFGEYRFVRSAQTFPDVRLVKGNGQDRDSIAMGVELKGWYLLAKERQPSFRYAVTPAACAPQDLIVAMPWHLEHVLSGRPVVHVPYIEQAWYAAEYRNWHWVHGRDTKQTIENRSIAPPEGDIGPYPAPKTKISDKPKSDDGSNFGRIARIGELMGDYISRMIKLDIAGIPAEHWIEFFRRHAEGTDPDRILEHLKRASGQPAAYDEEELEIAQAILGIVQLVRKD